MPECVVCRHASGAVGLGGLYAEGYIKIEVILEADPSNAGLRGGIGWR